MKQLSDERVTELCELPILVLPEEIRSIVLEIVLWRSLGKQRGEDPDILRDALVMRELRDSIPPELMRDAEEIVRAREDAARGVGKQAPREECYD